MAIYNNDEDPNVKMWDDQNERDLFETPELLPKEVHRVEVAECIYELHVFQAE